MLSIRTALVALTVALVVPLAATTGFIVWEQAKQHEQQIGKAMLAEAASLARSVDLQIATARGGLQALSHTRGLQEGDFASLHAAASSMVATEEAAFNVVLFASDGKQLFNTLRPFGTPLPNTFEAAPVLEPPGELPRSAAPWMREALTSARPVLSDVFFGVVAKQPIAAILVPAGREGKAEFLWSFAFELSSLQRLLASHARELGWQAVLIDRAGIIVARYPNHEKFVGRRAAELIRAALTEGASGFARGRTLEQLDVYRAHSPTADGWTAIVARPRTSVEREIGRPGFRWVATAAASLAGALLFVLWLARQLATPLQRLSHAAFDVPEGRVPLVDTALREVANLREALVEAAKARQVATRLALLDGLVRHAPVGVAVFDRDLRVVQINERAAMDGIAVEAHIGKTVGELVGGFGAEIEKHLRRVRDTGEPVVVPEIAGETPAAPGKQRWWTAEYFPLKDATGEVTHVGAVALEITQRKEAELALREADRRKDVYLATLAHELRNPLAPIRNAVALLRIKGPPDPDLIQAHDMIDRQAAHMARLLDDLLEVSRIAQGKVELRLARFDLLAALEDALETTRSALERHQVRKELATTPVWVRGDRLRLAQVFTNLLSNAAKYTDSGGHIDVCLEAAGDEAVVEVADDGMGIEPEMIGRVFEPFSQSEKALHRAQEGLGIGLALVRGLVELHGGTVSAHSDGPGKGSRFTVRLPLSQPPGEARAEEHGVRADSPLRKSIVVVDDNRDAADSLSLLLRLAGATVSVAYDGESGRELAVREHPEVAILDIGMPGLSGNELASELARLRPRPYLIAVTGWGQDVDRTAAEAAGFDRHLTKPVDPVALLALLRQVS